MRNIFTLVAVAIISFATLTGCQKSVTTTDYHMGVIIGGTPVLFNNSFVSVANNSATGAKTYIIEGLYNEKDYPYIYIYVPAKDTGTYTIGNYLSATHAIYATDTMTPIKQSVSGSVRIDTVTAAFISGSYNFTCDDGTVITYGIFHSKMF